MALLKGKLSREQENMEDILTSNVFGLFRYLSPDEGLLPFLALAEEGDRRRPLATLPAASTAEYQFWPGYRERDCIFCEPDVLIRITEPTGKRHIVLVEAKFHSGKSSEEDDQSIAPYDQLAREWDNLVCLAEDEGASAWLVYLTADYGYPFEDVEASRAAFHDKRPRKSLDTRSLACGSHGGTCRWRFGAARCLPRATSWACSTGSTSVSSEASGPLRPSMAPLGPSPAPSRGSTGCFPSPPG